MLTLDDLKGNDQLAGITDEQLTIIAKMSKKDEDVKIGAKTKAHWENLDRDVLEVLGIEKMNEEASHESFKRGLLALKEKYKNPNGLDEYKTKIAELEQSNKDLANRLSEGAKNGTTDEALKKENERLLQKTKDNQSLIASLKASQEKERKTFDEEKTKLVGSLKEFELKNDFAAALAKSGRKFSDRYEGEEGQKDLQQLLELRTANLIESLNVDTIEENGKKIKVLRGKDGEILRDEGNNYVSAGDKYLESIGSLLQAPRTAAGTGGKAPKSGNRTSLNLTGMSQIKADEAIAAYVSAEGIPSGTKEYNERRLEIRTQHNVRELPME